VAVSASSIESPLTQIGSDWIWWKTFPFGVAAGTLIAPQPAEGQSLSARVIIDSKAMRKIGLNQNVVFVMQSTAITSTCTTDVNGALRVLFKR